MAELSLYAEPKVNALARYHLDAALKALDDAGCILPMGELAFFDRDNEHHKLTVVLNEWKELPR